MRRLWAYILLAVTALLLVGTTFVPVFTQATSNIEYSNGYDLVFRVSNKDADGSKTDEQFEDEDAVNEIASIMETRLEKANVSNYRVSTQGFDTVKVTLSQENSTNYFMIIRYLSFNGTLALTNANDDYVLGTDFLNGEARLEEKNGYPCVVIPVKKDNSDYSALIETTRQFESEGETQYGETSQDAEGNEQTGYFIYLWYDYQKDYDTFAQTQQDNENYNSEVASKIFVKFNIDALNVIKDADDSDYEDYISTVVTVDADNDSVVTVSEVKNAYANARFYVNLLNASSLDYKVDLIYTKNATSWGENIFAFGQHVSLAWSNVLFVSLISILLVSLILIMYFKLGALAIASSSMVAFYAGIASLVLFSSEFNLAGLVALVLVSIISIASGIIYLSKIKDEAYKGRSLKKANSEAAKKSMLPIVDINVILMITGIFCYLFGGPLLRSFAAVAVIGGLASLVLNLTFLRGLMWLATNTTNLQGKYDLFGIEADKVPNLMEEEKQSYYGPYAEKDITRNKKVIGIASIILLVASVAGIITFGIIGQGQVYNSGSKVVATEIYFETHDDRSSLNLNEIQSIVDNLKVYKNDTDTVDFSKYVAENGTNYYTTTFTEEGVSVKYHYYTLSLNTNLSKEVKAVYDDGTIQYEDKLSAVLENVVGDKNFDDVATVDVKEGKITSQSQPKFLGIMIASIVSCAVSGLYLLLRYRLSRGLSATIISLASVAISGGIFALLRIPVSSYVAVVMPVIAVISLVFAVILMNKERELVLDDKTRNDSVENRQALLAKANGISYYPSLILLTVIAYFAFAFAAFGGSFSTYVFMLVLISSLIAFYLVVVLFPSIANFFFGKLKGVNIQRPRKKAKKAGNKPNKSAEPEEAVFIGIND